jgi:hypothetical protein
MGNSDVAPFSAMLIIAFTIMLYYFSLFFLIITVVPKDLLGLNTDYFLVFSIALLLFLIIGLYFLFVHNEKYKGIIKSYETGNDNRRSFAAIIFPLLAFVLFSLSMILKMLQNQGAL